MYKMSKTMRFFFKKRWVSKKKKQTTFSHLFNHVSVLSIISKIPEIWGRTLNGKICLGFLRLKYSGSPLEVASRADVVRLVVCSKPKTRLRTATLEVVHSYSWLEYSDRNSPFF